MKWNAGCNDIKSNKVAKLCNVTRGEENKTRKVKKKKNEEKSDKGRYGNSGIK